MAHQGKQVKRRPRRRSQKKRQPGWKTFLVVVRDILPIPALIFGAVATTVALLGISHDGPAVQQDTYLRQNGTTTAGTVAMVDEEERHTKHSTYVVFTPYVEYDLNGEEVVTELDRYSVIDEPGRYRKGDTVTVMIAPTVHDESDIGIRSDAARAGLERDLRNDIILVAISGPVFIFGASYVVTAVVRSRLRNRRRA